MSAFGFHEPSMDCSRYRRLLEEQWPSAKEPPGDELMALVERAVDKCPHQIDFWLMRADLIELHMHHAERSPYRREDILQSLEAAARIRPDAIEAHEALAEFCENELNDLTTAERAYERAIQLGGGPWVYTGLARVLARQGQLDQAFAALDPEFCPYHDEPDVRQSIQQLRDGNYLL